MSAQRPIGQIIRRAFESQLTLKLMSRMGLSEGAARTRAQLLVQAHRDELIRISRMVRQTGELEASLEIGTLTDDLSKEPPPVNTQFLRRDPAWPKR